MCSSSSDTILQFSNFCCLKKKKKELESNFLYMAGYMVSQSDIKEMYDLMYIYLNRF